MNKRILLTFDVEDWFQVENFKGYIPFSSWPDYELRVEKNTLKIIDILESFSFKPKATFFILGWLAEKIPDLVKEISLKGHEVASHGFNHDLCTNLDKKRLMEDLVKSREILESITKSKIYGYRAPSFAVDDDILCAVNEAGYKYDSSFNSFSMHKRYGRPDFSSAVLKGSAFEINSLFYEIPLSNISISSRVLPLGGGGYFRLFPFVFFKQGMKNVFRKNDAFVFYAHPWEFDPGQPRVEQASTGFKFRHYINLHKTEQKFISMIKAFHRYKFITVKSYLEEIMV
jgi:polysaccharide deacetylase family protein (PEP-CTERM system associated)